MKKSEGVEKLKEQPTKRKLEVEKYGKWFAEKATDEELLLKSKERIAEYKKWIENLEALIAEKEAEVKTQKVEALKASVSKMSAEEKAELLKILQD